MTVGEIIERLERLDGTLLRVMAADGLEKNTPTLRDVRAEVDRLIYELKVDDLTAAGR